MQRMQNRRQRLRYRCVLLLGVVYLGAGCGGDDPKVSARQDPDDRPPIVEMPPPEVRAVAPTQIRAGGALTILGAGFVEDAEINLNVDGIFEHLDGGQEAVSFVAPARYVNAGRLEWTFEPALPPAGFGHELGTFRGTVVASMASPTVLTEPSEATAVEIEVEPSLILWRARAKDTQCPREMATTIAMQAPNAGEITFDLDNFTEPPYELGAAPRAIVDVEAIGFGSGSVVAPLEMSAAYVDLTGDPVVQTQTITQGRAARFDLNPGTITMFEQRQQIFPLTVNFRVALSDGTTLDRQIQFEYAWDQFVEYDGNVILRELYPPVQVSGCLAGGSLGRNVSYSSGQSESRGISTSLSGNFSVETWILNIGFGFNTSSSRSSSQSQNLSISGRVLPGQYGVFYRQTQRLERTGNIYRRDACGDPVEVGQVFVTDWSWAPDLAFTTSGGAGGHAPL
ncbi:MAG: hypothetical protein AAFQ82_21285, partial [Myxococcota bacterium]